MASHIDPRFAAAIDEHDLAIPFSVDEHAAAALRMVADRGGAILLGEFHGIAENASVIHRLMELLGIRRLALEWEPELRPIVDRFLATGRFGLELDADEAAAIGSWPTLGRAPVSTSRAREALPLFSLDGRVTAGHFAALRALHEENALDQLILFQAGGRDWSERDRRMAQSLLGEWDGGGPILVVAGNLHTKLEPHRHGVPLGHHVAAAVDAAEITLDYARGRLFNDNTVKVLPTQSFDPSRPHLTAVDGAFRILLEEAHAAVVARFATPAG